MYAAIYIGCYYMQISDNRREFYMYLRSKTTFELQQGQVHEYLL